MPIYEYQATGPKSCTHCRERFETFQSMSATPLSACPECGAPIERVLSASAIHGSGSTSQTLSNKNLANLGFTKYQKAGDGHYEKVAGDKGPQVIRK